MPRYRQTDRRWLRAACVAGAYLVGVATLFTLQVGDIVPLPISVVVSGPPLVYAALSVILARPGPLVRRLSWIGSACLTHLVLGGLAAVELMWAGGLPPTTALVQVFILFTPAPALTVAATPIVLTLLAAPRPTPHAEPPAARPRGVSVSRRQRSFVDAAARKSAADPGAPPRSVFTSSALVGAPSAPPAPPLAVVADAADATLTAVVREPTPDLAPARAVPPHAPRPPAGLEPSVAREDDAMVRVSFRRVAAQLPAEAFVLPLDRLGESLKEPHALLVPRRVVLARMREDGIAVDWSTIAGQFPELALAMSEADFRNRYPGLTLSLPVDEVLAQLPPDTLPLVSAVLDKERLGVAPTAMPPPNGRATLVPPVPASPSVAPAVAPATPMRDVSPVARPGAVPEEPRVEGVDRQTVTRMVSCFSGAGTFEAAAERLDGTMVLSLVGPGLPREAVAACAARVVRFLAEGVAESITVRTTRSVVVLAAGPTPVVVAARRPGAPVALLELRAARAAVALAERTVTTPGDPGRPLRSVSVDGRVAGAGRALTSFGAVESTVFDDAGARVYVFSARGRDATPLAALALRVRQALGDAGGELGGLVSVVFRRDGEQTLVRPLASGASMLAAAGPVTRPGRAHRESERAATMLEAL